MEQRRSTRLTPCLESDEATLWFLRRVFHCLASSSDCGPVAIADTLLYEGGYPRKWLRLCEETGEMECKEVNPSDPRAMLDAVLKMHSRFANCIVWYRHGSCQEMAVSHLFQVFSSAEWQRQIACIQGVPSSEQQSSQLTQTLSFSIGDGVLETELERDLDQPSFAKNALRKLIAKVNESNSKNRIATFKCLVHVEDAYNKEAERALMEDFETIGQDETMPTLERKRRRKQQAERLKRIRDEGAKQVRLCWLRFVDEIGFAGEEPTSPQTSRTEATFFPPQTARSSIVDNGGASASNETMDLEFNSYVRVFCATTRHLVDVVLVLDPLLHDSENLSFMESFAKQAAQRGLRIVLVSLIKLQEESPRVAVDPPSNSTLSHWLEKVLTMLKVGKRKSRPLILGGIGIGANVVFHAAAFRRFEQLQGLLCINSFAYVDRTLLRFAASLSSSSSSSNAEKAGVNDAVQRIVSAFRNNFLDLRPSLALVKVPLVLVQATLDEVILPLHAEAIVNARGAPKTITSTIGDCLRSQNQTKSHIVWLKGSHAIIQERAEFLKNLLENIFNIVKMNNGFDQAAASPSHIPDLPPASSTNNNSDHTEGSSKYRAPDTEAQDQDVDESKASTVSNSLSKSQSHRERPAGSPISPTSFSNKHDKKLSAMLSEFEAAPERDKKAEFAAERKRELERKRKEERERKKLDFERRRPTESEERSAMMDEDILSKEVRRMEREEMRWRQQQGHATERLQALYAARQRDDDRVKVMKELEKQVELMKKYDEDGNPLDDAFFTQEDDVDLESFSSNALGSSVSGASKIRLDFLKFVQRQAVSIEKSNQLLAVVKTTEKERDEKVRKISEMDRAITILRSKSTVKNIAQASRKRRRQAEEASEELKEISSSRENIASHLNKLNVKLKELHKELSKINSSIQSDHIIITRRATDMRDMTDKLSGLLETLSREEEQLRIDRKNAIQRQTDLTVIRDRVVTRLGDIERELERCQNVHTKYCDSSIWQAGVMQRIRTFELVKYLTREVESLNEKLESVEAALKDEGETAKKAAGRLATLQREKAAMTAQWKLVYGALDLYESGKVRMKVASEYANKDMTIQSESADKAGSSSAGSTSGGITSRNTYRPTDPLNWNQHDDSLLLGGHALGRAVRAKPHVARSQEEREWVALDLVVNRFSRFYSEQDAARYRPYRDAELTESVVDSLFELPEELNLALPFIRSTTQLRAYTLMQKYSFGNDPDHLIELDRLEASRRRSSMETYRVFESIDHFKLAMQEEGRDEALEKKPLMLLRQPDWQSLYQVQQQHLRAREGKVHTFYIQPGSFVKQLAVHLVFEGGFDERGYVVGRISAALYYDESIPIGYLSRKHELSLCSMSTMGRFTLVHDPNDAGVPLLPGAYQVVVGAASLSRYSVMVMAEVCKPLPQAEAEAKAHAFSLSERLKTIDEDSESLTVSLYLSQRKAKLVENLVREAESHCERLELEMARISRYLETKKEQEEKGIFVDDEDEDPETQNFSKGLLVKKEAEFDKWVRLATSRRTELTDTRKGSEEMARVKRERQEEKEEKESQLKEYLKTGVITEQDIRDAEEERVNAMNLELKEQVQAKEKERQTILRKQIHGNLCWLAIHSTLYPEHASSSQAGRGGKKETTLMPNDAAAGGLGDSTPLTREELLALVCASSEQCQAPKTQALRELMLDNFSEREKWLIENPMVKEPRMLRKQRLNFNTEAVPVETDIDQRCRKVLAELERANQSKAAFLDSAILHASKQRFPAKVLRRELNRELDRLLLLQVKEQERFIVKEWRRGLKDLGQLKEKKQEPFNLYASGHEESKEQQGILDELESSEDEFSDEDTVEAKKKEAAAEDKEQEKQLDKELGLDDEEGESSERRRYCRACKAKPCQWTPPVDIVGLQDRALELRAELEAVKMIDESVRFVETQVARSVLNGGRPRMLRQDLLLELSSELSVLERRERLYIVDEELHRAYANNNEFMETTALHGYKQVQWTQNVISALEIERTKLIGKEAVHDLVEGILDFMLDGWVFGERETPEKDIALNKETADASAKESDVGEARIEPAKKWLQISGNLNARQRRKKAVELKKDVSHQLGETENVLRFGLFSLTLMYFRAMSLLKKSRFEMVEGPGGKKKKGIERPTISAERLRMDRMKSRREARQRALQRAMEIAAAGNRKRVEKQEKRRLEEQERLRRQLKKAKAESNAAVQIQRLIRGHLGRYAARKWAIVRMEEIAQQKLEFAAAVAVQRVFRGYRGRKYAEDKKEELAEFIAQLRAEEAREEEEEYWKRRPIQRFWKKARGLLFAKPPKEIKEENLLDPPPAHNF